MYAEIKAIEYYLPEMVLKNDELAVQFPTWSAQKIKDKTGIEQRHIASTEECASDLAYQAAMKLFDSGKCSPEQIDYILLCTQSPDYFLPTTACVLQNRLGIPCSAGALDFNLGCSGFIYGLSLAKGLIETHQASNVLLITAETYSKYIDDDNVSARTIFGDAAAATLVTASDKNQPALGPFVFGTDGTGADNLIVRGGALRNPDPALKKLLMNGPDIFSFTIKAVPKAVNDLLNRAKIESKNIDHFIFHQANEYILEHLRDKIDIPKEKFYIDLASTGNTVSSTIPIALKNAFSKNIIKSGDILGLIGFGVGYSWGGCILKVDFN
ncbi:MAG: ketoacyl-ACP synthase III [Gammaproteobacteria bacterium]|nr:ketoacyl-ACP synthase III [Gammaproteobacteria bacterium]MCH9762715.1 ketoacyl-ACP synthase III [Gammaproteobacteria bacterium]